MLTEQTGFQRDLLTIIAGLDNPSGQDIKREYQADTRTETTHGRLYPNLDALVEEGFVVKGDIDERTNYYEITDAGHNALKKRKEWEMEYIDFPQPVEA